MICHEVFASVPLPNIVPVNCLGYRGVYVRTIPVSRLLVYCCVGSVGLIAHGALVKVSVFNMCL